MWMIVTWGWEKILQKVTSWDLIADPRYISDFDPEFLNEIK